MYNDTLEARLVCNPLFKRLISKIQSYNINTTFTIKSCFIKDEWISFDKSDKLSLGRLFKNSIERELISGIEIIPRLSTNNKQHYKKVGQISFQPRFSISYAGYFDDYSKTVSMIDSTPNSAVIFYESNPITKNLLSIKLTCKKCSTNIHSTLFAINTQIVIPKTIGIKNRNTFSLYSIWAELMELWYYNNTLSQANITHVFLCSSNRIMMERCSAYNFGPLTSQDYEAIIQNLFSNFVPNSIFSINLALTSLSMDSNTYRKFITNY